MIGRIISHYKILEKLGEGGMGVVYKAQDTKLDRIVALKFLPKHLLCDQEAQMRFVHEAKAASALNHTNITTIHDIDEVEDQCFMSMEYIEGRSIKELLKEKTLSVKEILDIVIQIGEGLNAAHKKDIIHRDIKSDNIMLTAEGVVKIMDFGLAKLKGVTQLTKAGTTLGTVQYMSPEQAQGKEVDHRSDVFSLGVVLYEIVTGQLPFKGEHEQAVIYSILNEEPELISKYNQRAPVGWQQILDKTLTKDPAGRYQTMNDLIADLKRLRAGQQIPHSPSPRAIDQQPQVKSLAVLYLRNLGSADDEFLSYGITEDLIVDLTRIGTLRVAPMRKILKFRDSNAELEEIAGRLDVGLVLDGSIHKAERSVRVSAQLVDVLSSKNLWADRWEKSIEDLPQIKQALAQGVSQALEVDSSIVKAAEVGKPEAQNPRAYEYYLRGKYAFQHKQDKSDVEIALGLYRQALIEEPLLLAARAGLAEIFIHKSEYEQAKQELASALIDARNRNLRADQATILRLLANLHEKQSHWDEAMEYGNQAVQVSRRSGDLAGEAEALAVLVAVLRMRARFDEALALFRRVLEINRQLGDQQKAAGALGNMGIVYHAKGEYKRALALFEEALEITRRQHDVSMEASCISNIGATYMLMGDLDTALRYYEQALRIHSQLEDQGGKVASYYNNIAVIHNSRGAYRKAVEYYEKASAIRKELGERGGYALAHNNLAEPLTILGEFERAIKASNEALAVAQELDFPLIISGANTNIGFVHFCKGEHELAMEYYCKALEVAEQAGLRRDIARIHSDLSALHYELENYNSCRQHSNVALAVAQEIGEKEPRLKASAYMAAFMIREGEFGTGISQLRLIADDARNHGDPVFILIAVRLLGEAYFKHGADESKRNEGRAILEEALALAKEKEVAHEIKWISEILKQKKASDLR